MMVHLYIHDINMEFKLTKWCHLSQPSHPIESDSKLASLSSHSLWHIGHVAITSIFYIEMYKHILKYIYIYLNVYYYFEMYIIHIYICIHIFKYIPPPPHNPHPTLLLPTQTVKGTDLSFSIRWKRKMWECANR